MDLIFTVLFLFVLILLNLIINTNKKRFKKVKKYVYLALVIIILCLLVSLIIQKRRKKKERYQNQNGGRVYQSEKKIKKLLDRCQLPDNEDTRHCFRDNTHQTCCMLSPEVRKYADLSGNEIGKLSEKAFKEYLRKNNKPVPSDDELKTMSTPWCTCLGSQVCSSYKFTQDDKTTIKFVNDKQGNTIVNGPQNKCERYLSDKFFTRRHRTSGVTPSNVKWTKEECATDLNAKRVKIV